MSDAPAKPTPRQLADLVQQDAAEQCADEAKPTVAAPRKLTGKDEEGNVE